MTNRKFKRVHDNMKAAKAFHETARNLMTFYLGMKNAGISIAKIKEFDKELITNEVAKYRQEARDETIDAKVDRFLDSVGIPIKRLQDYVYKNNGKPLREMYLDNQAYNVVIDCLVTDLAVYLKLVNEYYGYGTVRLCRILDYMEHYSGNSLDDAKVIFGFVYGDEAEIPDMSLYRRKKPKIDEKEVKAFQKNMQAVKVIQGIS